jgi:hypothetical protein
VLGLVGVAGVAVAQPYAPAAGVPLDPREGTRVIETIKIWKMTEALALSEDQAARLFPKLTQLEASRRDFYHRQRLLRQELAELLRQQPLREGDMKRRLEELDRLEREFRGRERAVRGEIQAILSVEQQARLAVFEERFETEMRRTIQHLRLRRQGLRPVPGPRLGPPPLGGQAPLPVEGEPPRR